MAIGIEQKWYELMEELEGGTEMRLDILVRYLMNHVQAYHFKQVLPA